MAPDEPTSGTPSAPTPPPMRAADPSRPSAEGGFSPPPRSRLLLIVGSFVALLACLLVFGVIADDVHEQEANALDALLTPLLHSWSSPTLDAVMNAFTDLGSTLVVLPLLVVTLMLLVWRRHRTAALFLLVAMVGSVALNESLKLIFHRPRPQLSWARVQPEYSFPSGHAMNSLVFYVALALIVGVLWGRRAGVASMVVAIVLVLLIGTSRIYLGYHYFTDVVGGVLAGAAWLVIVIAAFGGGAWRRLPAHGATVP